MNVEELYYGEDTYGNEMFFEDEECIIPYTGPVEEYFHGFLCKEAEVVDGYYEGVCKDYYENSSRVEMIYQMKYSLNTGLSIEFYESGRVRAISLFLQNSIFDYIMYYEDGGIEDKKFWTKEQKFPFSNEEDMLIIKELREKYNLMKIHEEIVRDGENFNYKKYFGL